MKELNKEYREGNKKMNATYNELIQRYLTGHETGRLDYVTMAWITYNRNAFFSCLELQCPTNNSNETQNPSAEQQVIDMTIAHLSTEGTTIKFISLPMANIVFSLNNTTNELEPLFIFSVEDDASGNSLVRVQYPHGYYHALVEELKEKLGKNSGIYARRLSIFHGSVSDGPSSIAIKQWQPEFSDNYADHIISPIKLGVALREYDENLVVLTGPPGTGKTSYLKMMITEMCHKGDHMVNVVRGELIKNFSDAFVGYFSSTNKKIILLIEDVDSLLLPRKQGNNALDSILNLADGIENTNVKIIITTNLTVREIDDALLRPGRCLAVMKFTELPLARINKIRVNNGLKALNSNKETLPLSYAYQREVLGNADLTGKIGFCS